MSEKRLYDEPSSRAEADVLLWDRARRTVRAHLATREDQDYARSQKSMIDQSSREYGGRFLHELIQNGYDANPAEGARGRIAVLLAADEGAHGALYVANTGAGFSASNVRRIGSLGLSDKPIGAGIGNKGVGFKSVLQICTTPEVYSTLRNGEPGFCFRFATASDIPALVDGDEGSVQQVLDELSLYTLTIPTASVPVKARQFWDDGYATVIRLPLDEGVTDQVQTRLEEIESNEVPLMLFLGRLTELSVTRQSGEDVKRLVLTRRSRVVSQRLGDFVCQGITLGDAEDYLCFSRPVDLDSYREVIETAIRHRQLDKRYADIDEPPVVSVAVRCDAPDAMAGRIYTYLPMGRKATSPFSGHLNAPFYADFARKDIDPDHPLNRLLLRQAAALTLDVAASLTRWTGDGAANLVFDLVCWAADGLSLLSESAAASGEALDERQLLPSRTPGRWLSMAEARRWPAPDTTVLTPSRAAETCDVHFLPELPPERARRLDDTLSSLGRSATAAGGELADWTETMLCDLANRREAISIWNAAYADVAALFKSDPNALRSRRILLTDDWQLRQCAAGPRAEPNTQRDAPFFPPTSQRVDEDGDVDDDTDLALPKSLSTRIFFLHGELTWYVNQQQTPARRFLQDNRLVRGFETRAILDHIRGVLRDSKSKRVSEDALRYVLNLVRSSAAIKTDLAELGLRVKTADGTWRPAQDCLFSAAWPSTHGSELSTLAATSADRSPELHALSTRLVAPMNDLPRTGASQEEWVGFLRRIGVVDVLPLHSAVDDRQILKRSLSRSSLARVPEVPERVRALWAHVLPERFAPLHYPETPYVAAGPIYWLAGQGDWDQLNARAKDALARQILRGLKGAWPTDALSTTWIRNRVGDKDPQGRSTPLYGFLSGTPWLPLQRPGHSREEHVLPKDCWTYPVRGDDTPPRFAPLLAASLRNLIDDDAQAIERLRQVGVGVWGAPADAPRLVEHLGRLFHAGLVTDAHAGQFRNNYRSAWAMTAQRGDLVEPLPTTRRSYLVVEAAGTTTTVTLEPAESTDGADVENMAEPQPTRVVVAARDDERTVRRLLDDFGRNVLEVEVLPDVVTAILRRRLGSGVIRATEVAPVVLVNGTELVPATTASARHLVELLPWLPLLVATLIEHHGTHFVRLGHKAFEEAIDTLRKIRLAFAADVEVRLDSQIRSLPERMHGVLSIPDTERPVLLIADVAAQLTAEVLEAIAEPLAYLIGRREADRTFRWAFERVRRLTTDLAGSELTHADIAEVCDVRLDDVRTVALRLQSALTPLLDRLYPIIVHLAGPAAAARFDPQKTILATEPDVYAALADIAGELDRDPDELLSAAHDTATLAAFQRILRIPVAEMNATLSSLAPRYPLISYAEQHADDFNEYVRMQRDRLLDRIRWDRWPLFEARQVQLDWSQLRRVEMLQPDPAWGTTLDELTTGLMDERIEHELEARLGHPPPLEGVALVRRDDCARANADHIARQAIRLRALVRAWHAHRDSHSTASAPWVDEESCARTLRDELDAAGALDFTVLSSGDLLEWLQALGLWPNEMPLSDDLDALGLTDDDLDAEAAEQQRQRAERARRKRIVNIDDLPFDLDEGSAAFIAALNASLDARPDFLAASQRFANLVAANDPGSGSRRGGGGAGGGRRRDSGLSDRQKNAVGLAGEWLAAQWLQQRYAEAFTPECWVSTNREDVYPGAGDDGLGFDFDIPMRRGSHLYEVKATLGDGGQIELGETEVLAAQANARNRRWRLIVITDALSENRRLRVLPNPFDPNARGRYRFVGQGLRLQYEFA